MFREPKWIRPFLVTMLVFSLLFVGIKAGFDLQKTLASQTTSSDTSHSVFIFDSPKVIQDFTLPGTDGTPLSLHDLRNEFILLFFGYSHCTDFCPMTLTDWKRVKEDLGDKAQQVNFVFISVDGERDTPSVLKEYMDHFDPSFLAMSGNDATLQRIAPDYGLFYSLHKEEGANYSVDHSVESYLINPHGEMTAMFSFGTNPQFIATAIEEEMQ